MDGIQGTEMPAARAVVSDDGSAIWLTAYTEHGIAVPVALSPVRAVVLAGELIEAAVPKLQNRAAADKAHGNRPKRWGGDHYAKEREHRNGRIAALADLIAPGEPAEQQAREVISRLARFRPMAHETSPERRLMQEINDSGLPIGRERIRKILVKQGRARTGLVDQRLPRD